VSDLEAWDSRTTEQLEQVYLAAGAGPGGSGSSETSAGAWRAKRQHLCVPMDGDGTWLDVGCANGHLLTTLPAWCAERDIRIEPYGLELLPALAELARSPASRARRADLDGIGDVVEAAAAVQVRHGTGRPGSARPAG
jgi:hypothetical protein